MSDIFPIEYRKRNGINSDSDWNFEKNLLIKKKFIDCNFASRSFSGSLLGRIERKIEIVF